MTHSVNIRYFAFLILLSILPMPSAIAEVERIVITRLDDLPRLAYPANLPLEELLDSSENLAELAAAVQKDLQDRLEKFDIRDNPTLRGQQATLRTIALLQNDIEAVRWHMEQIREREDKLSDRLTSGLLLEAILRASESDDSFAEIYAELLQDLPWDTVRENILELRAGLQTMGEGVYRGAIRSQLQTVVDRSGELSLQIASTMIYFRYAIDFLLPRRDQAVAVLSDYINTHQTEKPDIWAERNVSLSWREDLTPVVVAIWDSGIDSTIFMARSQMWINEKEIIDGQDSDGNGWVDDIHGIAWDYKSRRDFGDLLVKPDEFSDKYEESVSLTKGFTDLQVGVESPEAERVRTILSTLEPDAYEEFIETLSFFGNYTHGTHVAGIAAAGNPAVRLLNARLSFDHKLIPPPPSLEEEVRRARSAMDAVNYFRQHNVRIVNMSWGASQRYWESSLQANGMGDDAEMRAGMARVLFDVFYNGIVDAMKSAPEILFIPAAGNSDDDVDFVRDVPSSIDLPNVLVVGAVDQAGEETGFTSHGRNVLVHANGYAVESDFPHGQRAAISGTSMSAPNVANLAAKLMAISPELSPEELKALIIETADRSEDGRRNLINPRRAIEALENL